MSDKPHLVIISDSIRRDLQDPLKYFKKVRITHLYRQANYQDMTPADFKLVATRQFDSGKDLMRLLNELQPDLIQGLEPFAGRRALLLSYVVWRYSKKTATPYLFPSMENLPMVQKHGFLWGTIINWWTGVYGRGAKKVIYLNEAAKQSLLTSGVPAEKLERKLWGNWGVDVDEFRPNRANNESTLITNKKNIRYSHSFAISEGERPVVLFVGKISVAKGVPWLLEAMEQVVKQFPEAKLWLAGPTDSSQFSRLRGQAVSNFQFVKHLGIIKNRDIADLYRQATIVAAPSITTKTWAEQVGNVNLQALSCGVPVVTTNSGAIPEYVKDGQGALIVPEKDSKALANAISRLLGNPGIRATQSRLARRWISERYDVRKNIAELDNWVINLLR